MYKILISESNDPAVNLATEEYLLCGEKYGGDDILLLWRGYPSVVIGKFQNAYEEVSLTECQKNNVPVYRRNSGGGTVYHDLGNVNFSFFTRRSPELPDYPRFLSPVVEFLRGLGIPATEGSSLDITVCGKKISGNAQSVHGTRMMHHGTLLFDCELSALNALTGHIREKIVSKSIKSNPSAVRNVKPYISPERAGYTTEQFMLDFAGYFSDGSQPLCLDDEDLSELDRLARQKYRTWEWNFGRSPAFELSCPEISLKAKNGIITDSSAYSDILCGERLIPGNIYDKLCGVCGAAVAERLVPAIFD